MVGIHLTWMKPTLNLLIINPLSTEKLKNSIFEMPIRGRFSVQNKVVTNFCKIDTIYITIIALIFVVIIMIIDDVIVIIVNVAINSGDWSMIIWLLLILSLTLSFVIIYIDLHNCFMFHSSTKYGDSKK